MNIQAFTEDGHGKLTHYVALAVPLTAVSIWILVALHNKDHHPDLEVSFATRLQWPVNNLIGWITRKRKVKKGINPV